MSLARVLRLRAARRDAAVFPDTRVLVCSCVDPHDLVAVLADEMASYGDE
jgi:hypothetical protein